MNTVQILNKIKRDLDVLGITATRDASSVIVDTVTITCVEASIQKPMSGIDPTVSPFLGIGVANPGQIKVKGAAGENTLAAIFDTELRMKVFSLVCGFANDKVVEAGDTTTQLAYIQGHPDLLGMGQ